ncbi:MAG: PEP/pyruvate-binding domain-containing protein, partial [Gammaproteobacteria bacterium]
MAEYVVKLAEVGMHDVARVGGKNASLGEMLRHLTRAGVRVPDGFATTADVYREFLAQNDLKTRIEQRLRGLDIDDTRALAAAGREIRDWMVAAPLPAALQQAVTEAYAELVAADRAATFAVRSSATAEDLPEASFAGQQETFLHVRGLDNVLAALRYVYASLYNDRAIAYRVHH